MEITSKLYKAIAISGKLHCKHPRKGVEIPYATHPFSVALILSKYTEDEDVVIAGLLHDVLEDIPDQEYDSERMKSDFGERIYAIVKEVTEDRDPNDAHKTGAETWEKRKAKYLENLQNDSQESLMVAAADKIHNLISLGELHKEMGDEMWKYFSGSKERSFWFYEQVLKILQERLDNEIVREYERVIFEVRRLF